MKIKLSDIDNIKDELSKGNKKDTAKKIGDKIGIDWNKVSLDQFAMGLKVESEHGSHDKQTNVTNDDPEMTGKIAWAHLKEYPDYYTRLEKMEEEAKKYWESKK